MEFIAAILSQLKQQDLENAISEHPYHVIKCLVQKFEPQYLRQKLEQERLADKQTRTNFSVFKDRVLFYVRKAVELPFGRIYPWMKLIADILIQHCGAYCGESATSFGCRRTVPSMAVRKLG